MTERDRTVVSHSDTERARVSAGANAAERELGLAELTIDRDADIPVGVQVAWWLRARIGAGALTKGQRLPGVRELAGLLGINPNTVRSVYQRLEQEGLVNSRHGTGTFVAGEERQSYAAGEIAAHAARQARQTGVDPRAVAAALYVAGEPQSTEQAADAERRGTLRGQIAALEQTLAEMQAGNPGLIPPPAKRRGAGPRLLSIAELERVRAELIQRLSAAETLLKAPAARERANRQKATAAEEQPTPAGQARARQRAARTRPSTRPSTA